MIARVSIIVPARDPHMSLAACLRMLDAQEAGSTEIILVDDGSTPAIDPTLGRNLRTDFQLLRIPKNIGRAAARNAGARAATGTVLVFVDSDCVPESPQWLQSHVNALATGAVAATGPLLGDALGFWDRYQQEASERRRRQHASGSSYAGTTANLSIFADAFTRVGGFEEAYAGYGFEDRDLLLRLAALGRIVWVDAPVRHMDALRLTAIRAKFVEAGGVPARLFYARHPAAYAQLGYARLDTRLHPSLRPIALLAGTLSRCIAWVGDVAIDCGLMPFAVGRRWVQATTAMAFLAGTSRR